jgi:hypothetical protein
VGGSSGSPDPTSAQNAIDRSNEYDPSVDKGFELSETELITKLNHDRFIRQLRVKVKIAGREIADDGKREVLEYDFGGCPRGIGSVDRYSKNVLSYTVTATHDCVRRGKPVLFVVYAAVLNLGLAKNEKEAIQLVSRTFEASKDAPMSETGVRSSSTTAQGRTLQIIGLPNNTGMIFKVYPMASDAEPPTPTARATSVGTFGITAQAMREKIGKQLVAAGGDTFDKCMKNQKFILCSFADKVFQRSVHAFKQLDLANGNFKLLEAMFLIPADGNIERIRLLGTRDTPMALFHFAGTLGAVLQALDPSLDDHDAAETALSLGVMRGDDDPSIGTEKLVIKKEFSASCIQRDSSESMKIDCNIVPRY